MMYALIKRKSVFTLNMLEDGKVISRKQYESLYKEISKYFSVSQRLVSDKIHCTIRRESVAGTRELFGKVYECPIPTSNHETFSFYIQSNELIS